MGGGGGNGETDVDGGGTVFISANNKVGWLGAEVFFFFLMTIALHVVTMAALSQRIHCHHMLPLPLVCNNAVGPFINSTVDFSSTSVFEF